MLQATWTGYQLAAAIRDEAVVAVGGHLLLAGGLGSGRAGTAGPPRGTILRLDPVTGHAAAAGHLALPVSDPAAAFLHGRLVIFGGRADTSSHLAGHRGRPQHPAAATGHGAHAPKTAWPTSAPARRKAATRSVSLIQSPGGRDGRRYLAAGHLPAASSGAVAVTTGGTTYLIGGANGTGPLSTILATTDGTRYSVAASLPVAVSDAGAVASGGRIWIFGGLTATGPASVIQVFDPATATATAAGRLPEPLAAESAFALGGQIFLAGGETTAKASSARSRGADSGAILRYDPHDGSVRQAGTLPMPVAHAAAAVVHGVAYLVGGADGGRTVPAVVAVRLVPPDRALPPGLGDGGSSGAGAGTAAAGAGTSIAKADAVGHAAGRITERRGTGPRYAPWLKPARGRGHLAPGSDPSALPADVLIADHLNNRLVIVDPRGRVRWVFPRKGDLARGQTFLVPDDAFFSPDGRYIIATQEDDQVISVIDIATHRIVYRYGRPGTPGMGRNRVDNPDDAMLMPGGDIIAADIKNCRVLLIRPPAHRPKKIIGRTTNSCWHDPPRYFGSPNGAFPMTDGHYLVTEINGDWASEVALGGRVLWSTNPPGVAYPSDTNEVYPGRLITADYSPAGQVVEFTPKGRLLWRFGGLNQPSLALPMPNGDILVNDDFNDRVIVVDPVTNKIVWQYGHTGVPGRGPGYLNDPDGLDLVPPDSLAIRNATTMGRP